MTTEQTLFDRLMTEAGNIDHTRVADLLIEAARALQSAELAAYAGEVGQMRLAAELEAAQAAPVAPADPAMVSALRFYAQRQHFVIADGDAWDTVSGEPPNYWCDDAGTATVEDGSIARIALEGKAAPAAPAPVPLTGEQLLRVAGSTAYLHAYDALRAVEAAHGIKP